jgi:signal transduction histidine kinase
MDQPGRRSWWAALTDWRNWRLPVKVGAILIVPVVGAVALGVLQIAGEVNRANADASIQQLVTLRSSLMPLISSVQQERWLAAEQLGNGLTVEPAAFKQQETAVDKAAANATDLAEHTLSPGTTAATRFQDLSKQLAGLPALRTQVLSGNADVDSVTTNYSTIVTTVLDFDQALATQFGDSSLTGPATALYDIEVTLEQVRSEEASVSIGLSHGELNNTEIAAVHAADSLLLDRLADFQTVANPTELADYRKTVSTAVVNAREGLSQTVLLAALAGFGGAQNGSGHEQLGVSPTDWTRASDTMATQLVAMQSDLGGELTSISASLQNQASDAAGIDSVILFTILLLATAVGIFIGRHLLRQLSLLRRSALDAADRKLPAAVASIDEDSDSVPTIEPVPVHTTEELGQLARAFDAVLAQAVRSAVGQASLRSNLGNIFVNLSRRSQGLVERQLRLMEQLERHEEDPEQLANLFKLDHLATRMRRNNENLMVLSGAEPERRSGQPTPLPDVLRAAVSEIEHYQRVVVRSTPSVEILGYASGDLVRLIAELLDNATSFSPPGSPVYIASEQLPGGQVRVDIRDDGIGMADNELAESNRRLSAGRSVDVPASRQMGLYVAGRLARRHSIGVSIEPDPEMGGLRAVVIVPPELVRTSADRPGAPRPAGPTAGLPAAAGSVADVLGGGNWQNELNGLVSDASRNGSPVNGNGNGNGNGFTNHGASVSDAATSIVPALFDNTAGPTVDSEAQPVEARTEFFAPVTPPTEASAEPVGDLFGGGSQAEEVEQAAAERPADVPAEWTSFHGQSIAEQNAAASAAAAAPRDLFADGQVGAESVDVDVTRGRDATIFADLPPSGRLGDPPVPAGSAPESPSNLGSSSAFDPSGFTWFDLPGRLDAGGVGSVPPRPVVPPVAGPASVSAPASAPVPRTSGSVAPLGPPPAPEIAGVTPGGLPRRVPKNNLSAGGAEPTGAALAPTAGASAPAATAPAATAPAATEADAADTGESTPNGLPRRVPRSHLSTNLADRPSTGPAAGNSSNAAPAKRKPGRARGFLDEYQAGVRQGKHRRPNESTDSAFGQEDR